MIVKLLFYIKNNFLNLLLFCLLFLFSDAYSQCAGDDASLTICDIQNPVYKNINLYNLLGGTPSPGGVWIDNSKPLETAIFNGILNAQTIRNSGIYTYTYVQDPSTCSDNEATITLKIGPYTGVPSNVSTCDDVESFNLFLAFDGTQLSPLQNGVWTAVTTPLTLSGNTINPKLLGEGNYSYTYSIPALDTCPAQSATISVSIFRKPVAGTASNLLLCSNANLASYSNLNLNNLLSGEDAGGSWLDGSGTGQITSSADNKIDLAAIYNSFGAGTYSFVYSVTSANPICSNSQSTVKITIEDPLNFTGSTLVVNNDICENEIATATYSATLTKGPQAIPNGNYDVSYSINNGTTTKNITVNGNFSNGVFVFSVDPVNLQAVGNYTFTITNIVNTAAKGACTNTLGTISDILYINPLPKINNASLTINPVCKGFDAQVQISGNTNLTNGNYRITYNLSGDNTATNQQATFTVTNGVGNFIVPANLIPNVGVNNALTITNIVNLSTACTNSVALAKLFTVKALPDASAVNLNINAVCLGQNAAVQLTGLGSMTNITVNFGLSGANVLANQNVTLTVSSGNASFTIPNTMLTNIGNTTLTLNSVLDNGNGCAAVSLNKTKSFDVNTIPANPTAASFVFCKNDAKTIANLTPSGSQYQWFDSVSSTTVLSTSTVLVTRIYYVKEVNSATGCESGRTPISVTINETDAPVLATDGQKFCGLDNPTIQSLSDKTTADDTLVWYDAATNGNLLAASTLLVDGKKYYAFNYSTSTTCYSDPLEVTVELANCEVTPDFFVPDGFSPNGDGKNDVFRIPDIQFIYPDFSLEIFNRYGNILFRGNKNKLEWDGRNSDYKVGIDGIAPNGVYFYVLHFNKGNKKPIQGTLYLNR
ncbi:gliding motility-associated C-terminal domain-containing protein [Flavobacterium nitratireducens]|uniref:gliding motility-associated C-terminal domain-containing protein n=1 Tax=Flavobacterium nitratireducens TaxID=992289 RepID=UPI0024156AF4|nr:gliding motility-associated C-terminal domain-containing protein [Flavobacterium nitratireducens]